MKTLLAHLSFLRPIRTSLIIAVYLAVSDVFSRKIMNLDLPVARLLLCNVAFPLLAGYFVAGACHEPLHRAQALLLPGLRLRQRRTATVTFGVVALIAAMASAGWSQSGVSPLASFGFAFFLSTLLSLNQYRRFGGQAGGVMAVAAWFLLSLFAGPALLAVMTGLPGLFLVGGLTGGLAVIAVGFSREWTRTRADTLFIAPQSIFFSYILHRGMLSGWQTEVLEKHNRNKEVARGPDWSPKSVRTAEDWRAVLWHAQFGALSRGSSLRMHLNMAAVATVMTLVMAGTCYLLDSKIGFWLTVSHCFAPDMSLFRSGTQAGGAINLTLLLPGMAILYVMRQLYPVIFVPISRRLLARISFEHALRQWAFALLVPTASLFTLSCLGQVLSGHFRPALGLIAAAGVLVPLAALLPWLLITGTFRRPLWRILAAIPLGAVLMVIAVAQPVQRAALTPGALVAALLLATAGFALLRQRVIADFATTDLTHGLDLTQSLGMNPRW